MLFTEIFVVFSIAVERSLQATLEYLAEEVEFDISDAKSH